VASRSVACGGELRCGAATLGAAATLASPNFIFFTFLLKLVIFLYFFLLSTGAGDALSASAQSYVGGSGAKKPRIVVNHGKEAAVRVTETGNLIPE